MVWAVPALVVPTMSSVAVDVPVAPWEPALPAPVLVATVAVPAPGAPVAPVAYTGRAAPVLVVVPMAATAFAVAVALDYPHDWLVFSIIYLGSVGGVLEE